MARYKIWDKLEPIYTLGRDAATGKSEWTAAEYIDYHASWAANPNIKIVVGGGAINGTVFMEFEQTKEHYKRMGCVLTDAMTDAEVLSAIEYFEDHPPTSGIPSAADRTAAALEFMVLNSMPDAE
jgi:hypothetical protein